MRRRAENCMVFTLDEVSVALTLAAALNPAIYTHPEAKALIHKAQAYYDNDAYEGFVIRG